MKDRDKSTSADAKMKTRKRTKRTAKDFGTAERKRVQEQIQALSRFPSENPNPVMRISKDGTVLYCNEAGSFILNQWKCQVGQLVPSNWRQLVTDVSISGVKKEFEEEYETRTFSFMLAPIAEVEYVNVYGRDITERKKAEEALRVSEERFRFALANSPIVVATLDRDLRYTWVYNPMGGFRSEDLLGKKIGLSTDPETSAMILKSLYRVLTDGESVRWEATSKTDAGEIIFESHAEPLRNAEGEITGAALLSINITERKKTEEALKESEERYSLLFNKTAIPASLTKLPEKVFVDVNEAFEKLFGYKREELIGKTSLELGIAKPEEQATSVAEVEKRGSRPYAEKHVTLKSGEERILLTNINALELGGQKYALTTMQDITERKKVEEALKQSERQFRSLAANAPDVIMRFDTNLRILYINAQAEHATGIPNDQFIGKTNEEVGMPPKLCELWNDMFRKAASSKQLQQVEFDLPSPDGNRTFSLRVVPEFDENASLTSFLGISHDITDIKKAEEALQKAHDELEVRVEERTRELREAGEKLQAEIVERKQAEEAVTAERKRFTDVLEQLPAYLVLLTPDYHVAYANRFFREHFGEDHGRRCFEYLFRRGEPCENCETYKTLDNMAPREWEWAGPDGHNYYIYDAPFTEPDGSTRILEVGIDTTERKRAEERLRDVSSYSRSLIEASLDPLVTISAEGKITDVNKATEEVTGFGREQLIGSDFSEYFTEPDNARAGYQKVFTDGFVTDYPLVIRHKSGKITDVLYNATVYKNEAGQIQGVFAAARDVTERKKAEEALRKAHDELETRVQARTKELAEASEELRESERDLNRAQAVAHTGSWRLDLQNNILLWSDETYRIFGIPKGTRMTYEAFLSAVHPDDREYVDQKWKAALQGGPYDIEHRIIVNREVKWVREKAELELDRNVDGLVGGFGTVQDITERKKAEQALYQAKQEWERTFDSVPDLIAIVDDQHRIVRANKAMAQQLGKTPEQCTGVFCYECIHGLNQPIESCPHTKTLQDGQQHIQELHEDRLGGDFLVSTTPLKDEKGRMIGSVHVARNITERKKMEAKLEQYARHLEDLVEEKTKQLKDSERLATIGQTAAMVGHDIRNPLQSVEGATYLVREELKSLPAESRQRQELEEMVSLIEKQTNYIDHIVSDLQDFSRTPMPQPREVDAEELIAESLATLDIPDNIEVQTALQEDLPPLTVDPTYIKRVLLNLIENAVQAMPNGGKLTVRAFRDEDSTCICVEDTGVGISEENKPKIFLPLFTTRAKGQGFGLSVCKKLVEAHAGTITFDSEVGRGTQFIVKLPLKKGTN